MRILAPLLVAATLAAAPHAQADRVRACLARAAHALEMEKPKVAAALAHRAARDAQTISDPRERKKIARELRAVARKADPDAGALASAWDDAADALLGAAKAMARKKWHRAALRMAEAAAAFDADAARKVLPGYRRKVDKLPAHIEEVASVLALRGDTGVFRMIGAAEDAVDEKRPDDAAELIVLAQLTLPTVNSARRRRELAAGIAEQAARLDKPAPAALTAMTAAAAPLRACAKAHAGRGWHRVALAILERAAALDAPGTTEAIAASRAALDMEYVGALDVLYEVFQISENVTNEGAWKILPDRVLSPKIDDSRDIMLVAKEAIGPNARFALRAAPTSGSRVQFGLMFGYRSRDDYLLLEVSQLDGSTFLQILHWNGSTYRKVAYGERDLTGWRGEPVEITLAMNRGELVARLEETEPLTGTVEATLTQGRIGLFVPEPACKDGGVTFTELAIEKM